MLAAAGCGGASTISRDEAMKSALDAAAEQAADPSSKLYEHRLQLTSATAKGHANWLVRLRDRTSGRMICVLIATAPGAITASTNLEFRPCGQGAPSTTNAPIPPV